MQTVLGQEGREFLDGHWENAKVTIVIFHPQIVGRGTLLSFALQLSTRP